MKKIFLVLMAGMVFFACQPEEKKATHVVFNGKIANYDNTAVLLFKSVSGKRLTDTINVSETGKFQIVLDNSVDKQMTISYSKKYVRPYFEFGDTLGIEFAEDDNGKLSISFTGATASINEYMMARSGVNNDIYYTSRDWDIENMNFIDYASSMDSMLNIWEDKLAAVKTDRNEFLISEKENLNYIFTSYKSGYAYSKKRATEEPLDEDTDFIQFIKSISETEIKGDTSLYISMLESKTRWLLNVLKEQKELGDSLTIYSFNIIDNEVKNNKIKNRILFYEMRSYLEYYMNSQLEATYATYKSLNTDPVSLKKVEGMYEVAKNLLPGKEAPNFEMFDMEGNKFTLESFRGKYVYIDVWATWCGPCKGELPFLDKLYKNLKSEENLIIMSISIDKESDKGKLIEMIKHDKSEWSQYIVENEWESELCQKYNIGGIPNFMLIDPEGKIVNANEKRPSNPGLENYLKELIKK